MTLAQMPIASNSWEFYSLIAGMAFILVRQWMGDKARQAGIKEAKLAAIDAADAAIHAGLQVGKAREELEVVKEQTNGGWASAHKEIADLKAEVMRLTSVAAKGAEARLQEIRGDSLK